MPLRRECPRCGKKFQPFTPSNKLCNKCRDIAMLRIRGIGVEKYTCHYCDLKFRYKISLHDHIKKAHERGFNQARGDRK